MYILFVISMPWFLYIIKTLAVFWNKLKIVIKFIVLTLSSRSATPHPPTSVKWLLQSPSYDLYFINIIGFKIYNLNHRNSKIYTPVLLCVNLCAGISHSRLESFLGVKAYISMLVGHRPIICPSADFTRLTVSVHKRHNLGQILGLGRPVMSATLWCSPY